MVMFTPYIGNLKNEKHCNSVMTPAKCLQIFRFVQMIIQKENEKILFEWPREYNSNLLLFDIYIAIFFQLSIP